MASSAAAQQLRRRPFSLPLTLGTDICHIPRIRRILDGPHRDRFIARVLRPDERPRAYAHLGPEPTTELGARRAAEYVAGRFAAKEAVIKAHPHLGVSFGDITIAASPSSSSSAAAAAAAAVVAGGPASAPPVALVRSAGVLHEALVSISHDAEYATAVCVGMAPEPAGAGQGP